MNRVEMSKKRKWVEHTSNVSSETILQEMKSCNQIFKKINRQLSQMDREIHEMLLFCTHLVASNR